MTALPSYSLDKRCSANTTEIFLSIQVPSVSSKIVRILSNKLKAKEGSLTVFCNCTHLSGKVGVFEGHCKYCLNRSSNACPMVLMTSWARPSQHSSIWQAKWKRLIHANHCLCHGGMQWPVIKHLHVQLSCPISDAHISIKPTSDAVNFRQSQLLKGYIKLHWCVTAIDKITNLFHYFNKPTNRKETQHFTCYYLNATNYVRLLSFKLKLKKY